MRFREMRLRIGRVTLDTPLGEGVTAASLTDAIRAALATRTMAGSAGLPATMPHPRAAPLAGAIAARIADTISARSAHSTDAGGGGGNDRR